MAAVKKSAPAKTETTQKPSPYLYYTVKPGDTLSEIAEKKGSTVSKIKTLNGLKKSSISAGMRLKINRT